MSRRIITLFRCAKRRLHPVLRRAAVGMLTVLSLTGAGAACTTPQQSARLLFQRGATSLPPKLIWQAFDGQIAIEPGLESAELNVQLGVTLNEVMRPQSASSPLSLRLQSLILGCRSKPRPSCGCRTVIELVGSDQQTTLRGMEGIAVLTLARPADADALLRAAPSLVEHAIQAALEAPDQRSAASTCGWRSGTSLTERAFASLNCSSQLRSGRKACACAPCAGSAPRRPALERVAQPMYSLHQAKTETALESICLLDCAVHRCVHPGPCTAGRWRGRGCGSAGCVGRRRAPRGGRR